MPSPFPLQSIHTFEQLLASLHALNQQHDFIFSGSLFTRLQQITIQLSNVRYIIDCKLRGHLTPQQMQFHASLLECLTDVEEAGVEGWVKWVEILAAERQRADDIKVVRSMVPDFMDRIQAREGERNRTIYDDAAARQHRDAHLQHIIFRDVFDEHDDIGRSDTESPHVARFRRPGPDYQDGASRNCRIQSNQAGLQCKRETPGMNEYENTRYLSPSRRRKQSHEQIGPYLHIPLPPGFTIPNHGQCSCPITFAGLSSVFYFPLGISRVQLLSFLHSRRQHDHMGPSFEPGEDATIIHVCTPSMKRELTKAIEKTGVLFNPVEKNGEVKTGRLWEESQGDVYIVSGPGIGIHVQNDELSESDENSVGPIAGAESDFSSQPWLRGGNVDASFAPYDPVPPPTVVDTSTHFLTDHFARKSNDFHWMQEAHTLQLKLLNMQDKCDRLEKEYQDARVCIGNEDGQLKDVLKNMGYWINEAMEARANEEAMNMKLSRQNQALHAYKESVEDMKDSVDRVVGQIRELKAAMMMEKAPQDFPIPLPTVSSCGHSQERRYRSQERAHVAGMQGYKDLKGCPSLRGGGASPTTPRSISPRSFLDNGDRINSGIDAAGFYFFPGVAAIAVQTEPMHVFQWPHSTTLTQVRNCLRDRHREGTEDHPGLIWIREIFEKRDTLGIPDPDTSTGMVVFVSIPSESAPHFQERIAEKQPSRRLTDEIIKEWRDSTEHWQSRLIGAINLSQSERDALDHCIGVNHSSDADSETRFKSIGSLINFLNHEVDSADEYEPISELDWHECTEDKINFRDPWRGGGDNDSRNARSLTSPSPRTPNDQFELDEKEITPPPDVVPKMFPAFGEVGEHGLHVPAQLRERSEHLLHRFQCQDDTFRHPKGQCCESWTGYLDPRRDRCSYCNFAFVELEPYRPANRSSSGASSDLSSANTPTSSSYRSSPKPVDPYLRGGADIDTCMTTSWPFKVCTNPYAIPSFEKTKKRDPTPFPSMMDLCPLKLRTNRYAVPSSLDDTLPPKTSDDLASNSSSNIPFSWKRAKSKENSNPEQTRDFYRRQAEEPTIQERIEKVEAMTWELIKLTQKCEEKEMVLQRLITAQKAASEPNYQVRSPPFCPTSIDVEEPVVPLSIEPTQRNWEKRKAKKTGDRGDRDSISETEKTFSRSWTVQGRPTSRAQSPWMGDIDDAVEYIVPPRFSVFSNPPGYYGRSIPRTDRRSSQINSTVVGPQNTQEAPLTYR
jgi:hypothetical protein